MENKYGVYCKCSISDPPVLLMEGTKERCEENIRETAENYESKPQFKVELIEAPAFQLAVTDMGSRSLYPTKYFFLAPIGSPTKCAP